MTKHMESENICIHLHKRNIMENGMKTSNMAKAKSPGLMGQNIMDTMLMELNKGLVNSIGLMELYIVGILLVVGYKVKELINGMMEEFMLEIGKKIK